MIISCGETKHDITNYILDSSTRHRKLKYNTSISLDSFITKIRYIYLFQSVSINLNSLFRPLSMLLNI